MAGDDLVAKAREFAIRVHAEQLYGTLPYVAHLDDVAELVAPYGTAARVIAYLHDVLEDTDTTQEQLKNQFCAFVAECVALLTDPAGFSRRERKAALHARLAGVSGIHQLALVVKVADRLANVRRCVSGGNDALLRMYHSEHQAFREAAYRPELCDSLWAELDAVLVAQKNRSCD